jgi:hypothetical protein
MQGILRSVKTRWINPEDMNVSLTSAEATGAAARSSTKLLPKLTVPLQSLVRALRKLARSAPNQKFYSEESYESHGEETILAFTKLQYG